MKTLRRSTLRMSLAFALITSAGCASTAPQFQQCPPFPTAPDFLLKPPRNLELLKRVQQETTSASANLKPTP